MTADEAEVRVLRAKVAAVEALADDWAAGRAPTAAAELRTALASVGRTEPEGDPYTPYTREAKWAEALADVERQKQREAGRTEPAPEAGRGAL